MRAVPGRVVPLLPAEVSVGPTGRGGAGTAAGPGASLRRLHLPSRAPEKPQSLTNLLRGPASLPDFPDRLPGPSSSPPPPKATSPPGSRPSPPQKSLLLQGTSPGPPGSRSSRILPPLVSSSGHSMRTRSLPAAAPRAPPLPPVSLQRRPQAVPKTVPCAQVGPRPVSQPRFCFFSSFSLLYGFVRLIYVRLIYGFVRYIFEFFFTKTLK